MVSFKPTYLQKSLAFIGYLAKLKKAMGLVLTPDLLHTIFHKHFAH